MKQNKEHDEQIIVEKLQQEMFKRQESSTFMNKKNDFFVNCYGINLAMCSVYNAEYQITMTQIMQNLRFFYYNNNF